METEHEIIKKLTHRYMFRDCYWLFLKLMNSSYAVVESNARCTVHDCSNIVIFILKLFNPFF